MKDCELPPIIEEESGCGVPMVSDPGFLHESSFVGAGLEPNKAIPVSPVVAKDPPSQELAIVLYNPVNATTQGLVKSPSSSDFSIVMNPELLSGWKSKYLLCMFLFMLLSILHACFPKQWTEAKLGFC